ncbi:MAG: hypothetical protein ACI943_002690 [Gammaproteobacteria bacterium]|jgi:hypothetical protein
MRLSLIALVFISLSSSMKAQEKINGVSFVALPNVVTNEMLDPVCDTHANWITLMPFAYGQTGKSELRYVDKGWGWWGETPEGIEESIKLAHARGLKVMIKPQLWFSHGDYTGHFELSSDADWKIFESAYYDYIMLFAQLSAKYDLPLMCIGTELTKFSEQRPSFWRALIKDIRAVYKGKLTYAANWDSFHIISFWDDLDYIGIDAYFPLCDHQTPSLKALMRGWQPHFQDIQAFSSNANKEVLFTEWGYRSTDYCAKEPWDYSEEGKVNLDAQYNAYQAVFKQFWHEPWFAGGFIWKWFPTHDKSGGPTDNWFTPQNKPAQDLIRQWYSTNKSN